MTNPLSQATRGAALRPLSTEQIRNLVLLAREAYALQDRPGLSFDDWRRREVKLCVERHGLRDCRNEDFLPLKAHFLELLGRRQAAEECRLRHDIEPRSWALMRLHNECREAADVIADPQSYVAAIARSKFKTALIETDLSENQIWQLVFHIRKAAQRRRQSEEVPF